MTKLTPILRQKNPSGRLTYYTVNSRYGMQKLTRPVALAMINSGDGYWANKPAERTGGPGADEVVLLISAAREGFDLATVD